MSNTGRGPWVTIGDVTFDLAEQAGDTLARQAYDHRYDTVFANRTDISGVPGKQSLRQEILLWDADDFSGGEGAPVFNSSTGPTKYSSGLVNPRNPGYITAPPTRTDGNIATGLTSTIGTRGFFATAGGAVWFAGEDGAANPPKVYYSTNTTSWTSVGTVGEDQDPNTDGGPDVDSRAFHVLGMTGGLGKYVYVSLDQTVGGVAKEDIRRISTTTNDSFARGTSVTNTLGMARMGPYLYRWTGAKLSQYDVTAALPTTGTVVFSSGLEAGLPTTYYGDCVAADNVICMMFSQDGDTTVYKYDPIAAAGTDFWHLPHGFTARSMGFALGVLYVAGTYLNNLTVFALNISTQQEFVVAPPGGLRQGTTLTPISIKAGLGGQVLIGCSEGYVFIYDAVADAWSELDERTSLTSLYAVHTYKDTRLAAFRDTSASAFKKSGWATDPATPAVNGTFTLISGVWDYDLPMEKNKLLLGFHVASSTLSATQTVEVDYQLDESGSYTTTTALTSGADNYVVISSSSTTKKFGRLRFRVIGTGSGGSTCPIVYGVIPRAYVLNWVETWDLTIKLRDNREGDSRARRMSGPYQRDQLLTLMENREVVSFVDGYRKQDPSESVTKDVTIEDVQDIIIRNGEGTCRLTLRSVAP